MQVVKTEFVLVAEDMAHECLDVRPRAFFRPMCQRRILVLEIADYRLIINMGRNTAESVIFRNVGEEVLAIVLTDSLDSPRYAAFHKLSGGIGLADELVVGCADTLKVVFGQFGGDVSVFFFHWLNRFLNQELWSLRSVCSGCCGQP